MQALNCLIVEDEPLAAELLADYVQQVPGLRLVATCGDIFAASESMRQNIVDLVFLDINLPGASGLELIRSSQRPCHYILTTAYHQHAVEAFDLNVIDYLLKPIEFSRFLQAVQKVYERRSTGQAVVTQPMTPPATTEESPSYHFFKVDKKKVKVELADILFVESLKDYIRIHRVEGALVTKFPIGELTQLLGEADFVRIHKSYVVNLRHVRAFSAAEVEVGGTSLPIGRTYRKAAEKRLEELDKGK